MLFGSLARGLQSDQDPRLQTFLKSFQLIPSDVEILRFWGGEYRKSTTKLV